MLVGTQSCLHNACEASGDAVQNKNPTKIMSIVRSMHSRAPVI